jgi:hypothetical protein
MMIICTECGREFSSNATACPKCGNPAPQPLKATFTSAEAKALRLLQTNTNLPAISRVTKLPIPEVKRLLEALVAGQIPEEITIVDDASPAPDTPAPDGQAPAETPAEAPKSKPKPKPAKMRVLPQAPRQEKTGCGAFIWNILGIFVGSSCIVGAIADKSGFWMAVGILVVVSSIAGFFMINRKNEP